eukprot:CAMPEP_0197670816 /NCGR_PEP_ID=MMETSP1338-20131121/75366_1 /TAXON_ID=43686 ORGANISM="Pelagodinium beii, Strain RCC1491" /NCGR_SAMPLE_ID=MMETSP1338 /ASSEMBLY_ACC=CAM_ASM_000754 /LENGTH=43 /DNA_ID= /DNA_START= /DNA_END= /DNA_ORIENTATION=
MNEVDLLIHAEAGSPNIAAKTNQILVLCLADGSKNSFNKLRTV